MIHAAGLFELPNSPLRLGMFMGRLVRTNSASVVQAHYGRKVFDTTGAGAVFPREILTPLVMNSKSIPFLLVLAATLISGCSTVEPGKHFGSTSLDTFKTAYVVIRPDYDPKIGANIQEALAKHAVTATAGSFQEKPKDVAFFVEYEDHWRWDLAMYLYSLDIRFMDNATGTVIGSGSFRQGAFHDFPNAREKTIAVVDSIFNAK